MGPITAELQKSSKASLLSVILVLLLWLSITARPSMAAPKNATVGVILDLDSTLGKMVNNSLQLAVENYYSAHTDTATKISLIVRNVSKDDVVKAAAEAYDLIKKEKVRAILGPQNSEQARFPVRLGEQFQVPVIWFPITGPSLLPPPSPSSIYSDQGLSCFQFRAIADVIKALGWQSIVPIYEETEYGSHLIPCLSNVLKDMGTRMAYVTAINSHSKGLEINSTLDKLNNTRPHVFLVHLSMDLGKRFMLAAQRKEMMGEGYAWILTQELSSLTDPLLVINRTLYHRDGPISFFYDYVPLERYIQGAIGVRPLDLSKRDDERRKIEKDFHDKFRSQLTIYGWWAYHTIEALAKASEKVGTDNGTKLREEILATNFIGVSGVNFNLSGGQIDQSVLEVYNVIGDRERIIGSWNPKTGLDQKHDKGNDDKTSSEYHLQDPIWPGDTFDKPPKLRIGVPRTNSFPEFVAVDDNDSSKPLVDGFAINVFSKATNVLPFSLHNYEFVPLPNQYRSDTPMTYDDILCSQMKEEDLDAIIGDITIVANRTKCVDFTFPYLDSSVAMVVRVKKTSTSKGILLKPFRWSLWLILGGIFAGATIIINVFEKIKDTESGFQNPFLVYKIDVVEVLKSGAAGWMVILTSFLFILVVQVYTAKLTSILTQGEMREPSFKDESEIKSSNVSVGYRKGSWVRGLLIEQIGFEPSRLKPLGSREEYNEALSDGTEKGGVDAIFDETPYLTLFLSRYKSDFMMTGPMYQTGGLAFAFPKKSGFTSHFSTAILNVTQDVEPYRVMMSQSSLPTSIEDLEFEDQSDITTSSLSVANIGGLYPVLTAIVVTFLLGLFILNPRVIQLSSERIPCLRQRLCTESSAMDYQRLPPPEASPRLPPPVASRRTPWIELNSVPR